MFSFNFVFTSILISTVLCPDIHFPNGRVLYSLNESTTSILEQNTTASFECNSGYEKSHVNSTSCDVGVWTNEIPDCIEGKKNKEGKSVSLFLHNFLYSPLLLLSSSFDLFVACFGVFSFSHCSQLLDRLLLHQTFSFSCTPLICPYSYLVFPSKLTFF